MTAVLSLLLALGATAHPAQETDALPDAEKLLEEMRSRIDPDGKLSSFENLVAHGTVLWEGLEEEGGTIAEAFAGLRRSRSTLDFGLFGKHEFGVDGEIVWETGPIEIQVRHGWIGSEYMRSQGIAQHVPWREMYTRAECTGVDEIEGRRCWRIVLTPRALVAASESEAGELVPPDHWLVDMETHLPRRYVARSIGLLDEPVTIRIDADDWRAVDGVLYAHRVRVSISGFTLEIRYDSYQHDVELPEGHFKPGPGVLEALSDLKSGRRQARDEAIVVETLEERQVASIRLSCARKDMQRTLAVLLPEVMQHVISQGAGMAGQPLVVYHSWGDPIELEAAIPVAAPVEGKGRVKSSRLPAGEAVVAWHIGPYDKLGETHGRIQAFMEQRGLERRAPCWEEYWTDPGMEPDPSKWRTRVVWPVKQRQR